MHNNVVKAESINLAIRDDLTKVSTVQGCSIEDMNKYTDSGSENDDNLSCNNPNSKKRERRSRDDNFQRSHVCGCGKSYLSYAALYTHIKTKHEGQIPDGTNNGIKKRVVKTKKEEVIGIKINTQYQKAMEFTRDFSSYLETIPSSKSEDGLSVEDMLQWPFELYKTKEVIEPVHLVFSNLILEFKSIYGDSFMKQIDLIIFEISNMRKINCNEIFSFFLLFCAKFVSKQFFNEMIFFVLCYRNMMNSIGWQKVIESSDDPVPNKDKEFCQEQN